MSTTPQWVMFEGEGLRVTTNTPRIRALLEAAKEKMNEAILAKLSIDLIFNRFSVADFGCASGPNTFVAVQSILDAVEDKYRKEAGQNPTEDIEFQALFNDFTNNDFNTLFKTLPASRRDMHCTGFNEAVKKAYLDQYCAGTKNLLDARAEELLPGGLMLLFGSVLRDRVKMSKTAKGMGMDFIGASLNDLAQQGVIEQDKVDSFSTPLYIAEEGELRQIIKENGKFTIEAFEDIIHPYGEFSLDPKVLAVSTKASFGAFLSAHFGVDTVRKAFEVVDVKAWEEFSRIQNAKPGMKYLIVLCKN